MATQEARAEAAEAVALFEEGRRGGCPHAAARLDALRAKAGEFFEKDEVERKEREAKEAAVEERIRQANLTGPQPPPPPVPPPNPDKITTISTGRIKSETRGAIDLILSFPKGGNAGTNPIHWDRGPGKNSLKYKSQ